MTFGNLQVPQASPFNEYLTSRFKETSQRGNTSAKYLEGRIRTLIAAFIGSKFKEGYRLVEADYGFGGQCAKVVSMFRVNDGISYDLAEAHEAAGEHQGLRLCTVLYSVTELEDDTTA